MEPHDGEGLTAGFVYGNKCHRARIIEFRQLGDELRRKFLDGIEEAKPEIFLAHMRQQIANQAIVTWLNRPDKYPPGITENDMPLPLRRIRADVTAQAISRN